MAGEPVAFIAAAIKQKLSASDWIAFGVLEPMFLNKWEKAIYKFTSEYVRQFGKLPTRKIMQGKFDDPFIANGDVMFHHAQLEQRFLEHSIRAGVNAVENLLQNDDAYDPAEALAILRDTLTKADLTTKAQFILDSRKAMLDVFASYKSKIGMTSAEKGLQLGWPSVDVTSGGIEGGEVISLVGRPATGKTWMLLYLAMKGWEQGRRPVFVTLEMPGKQIIERQIGITAGIDYGPIKSKTAMMKHHMEQVQAVFKTIDKKIPFYVVDAQMAATVSDIEMITRSVGGDVIYIDGAYLLKHEDGKLNRYQRVAENMDLIKDAAMRLNIPVVCSWQFNREAAKKFNKKNSEDPDLEDIGYSDAIGQHSSIILGLLQNENLATIKSRKINILKGRGGEQGTFHVAWDFLHSFFGEKDATVEGNAIFLDGPE